jgi:serine/threonine-protein phosphatase 2A activator
MWEAEVLGKFPVVQHFPFGSLFTWERDPLAVGEEIGVHTASQPVATGLANGGGKRVEGGAMTAAPWASSSGGMNGAAQTTKTPWAAASSAPTSQQVGGMPPMRAPWASQGSNGGGGSRASASSFVAGRRP